MTAPRLDDATGYVHWFRQAAPYIKAHRGKTLVLALPGEALEHDNRHNLIHDIALLHSLGLRLVLVHGCRPQIDARLQDAGLETPFVGDRRITDERAIEVVREAASAVRSRLEAHLSMGLPHSPMHGLRLRVASGNFVAAQPVGVRDGVDYRYTGLVRRIDTDGIRQQLDQGSIVLLSPLGYSATGETFNLGQETVAVRTATALNADKLIYWVEAPGLLLDNQLVREIGPAELQQRLAGDTRPAADLYRHLAEASQSGVQRCHLVDFREDGGVLLELFTRDGSGSLITRDEYECLRQATAEDIADIVELIRPLEEDGTLVPRSRDRLLEEIGHFTVIERDGAVIAAAALFPFPDDGNGEIACVVTDPDYRGHGRAAKLLHHLEQQARTLGLRHVFVLTTVTAHWFLEQGFAPASLDRLPGHKQALYNYRRNSQLYQKTL